jgi:hypothetical protein
LFGSVLPMLASTICLAMWFPASFVGFRRIGVAVSARNRAAEALVK